MELYQLNAFMEVARQANLTRAARTLHISVSALSVQIKTLEQELAVTLFMRAAKGMQLTESGRLLREHASKVIQAAEALKQQARQLADHPAGQLRIGINTDPDFLKMSLVSRCFEKELPDVTLGFIPSQTLNTERMLRDYAIDIGYVYGQDFGETVIVKPLAMVTIRVVVPVKIAADPAVLGWEDIARLPWIWADVKCPSHLALQREMDRHGIKPNAVTFAVDESITKELVKDGKGLALVRQDEAENLEASGIARIWPETAIQIPIGLAWLSERDKDPLIQSAFVVIQSAWPQSDMVTGMSNRKTGARTMFK